MLTALLPFIAILPATAYSIISLACALKYFSGKGRSVTRSDPDPGVTILKPVKGIDAGSYDNFASFCHQEYTGKVQMIFAAASGDDAVIPVIRRLIADFPGHDISLVVNPSIHGQNYKVSNLINAYPEADHDIIIICDCDIRVTPKYLRSVTAHFRDPLVGLVTSLYRTSHVSNIASAIEATGLTTEMVPNILAALQLEGLTFALGASMAVRREALFAVGGFEALTDYLADDYHLGYKIQSAGWDIALDGCFVESMMKAEDLKAVLSRQLRWARTMRASRPGGYLAYGITLPFPAVLLALVTAPSATVALAAMCLLYTVRLAVSTAFSRSFVRDGLLPRWLWLIPLRDMLAFFCWALSFMGNRVEWRGSIFRLKPGGKIHELS
jgi:ceramide glucosyltransferase